MTESIALHESPVQSAGADESPPNSTWIGSAQMVKDAMAHLATGLAMDARLANDKVTRPHPLLACVRRERMFVVLAPAAVWERGRSVLRPFAAQLTDSTAALVLLGRPSEPDLAQALNRGLCSLLPAL